MTGLDTTRGAGLDGGVPSSSRSAVDGVLSIGARSIKGSINSSVRASYFFGRYFVRTNTNAAMKSGKVMPMTGTSVTKKITTANANCSRVKRAMTGNSKHVHRAGEDLRPAVEVEEVDVEGLGELIDRDREDHDRPRDAHDN